MIKIDSNISLSDLKEDSLKYIDNAKDGKTYLVGTKARPLFYIIKASSVNQTISQKDKKIKELESKIKNLENKTSSEDKREELTKPELALIKVKTKLRFFSGVNNNDLISVCENVDFIKYKNNEIVFRRNTVCEEIYFIITGSVKVVVDEKTIAILKSKQVFGEMAYITKDPRSADIRVSSPNTILLRFNIKKIAEKDEENAHMQIYKNFSSILSKRLAQANIDAYAHEDDIDLSDLNIDGIDLGDINIDDLL
ncbi:MAG: cyclic nucleotide-binding domain-containing protein [Helicobacteraceae bacterium]|nr:cyclic nucleotide-binding domain-containing protein [Helicobacteraceae bacterium]